MRRILFLFLLTVSLATYAGAQILRPVKWTFAGKKINKTQAEVILTASIQKGWHIYDQGAKAAEGPIPTSFTFIPSPLYKLVGKPTGSRKAIPEFDKTFGKKISFFEGTVSFTQTITIISGSPEVKGSLEYMVCSDRQCLPPETVEFSVALK